MSRPAALLLASLLLAAAAPPETPTASPWTHNARRRTAEGIERLERGETDAALEAFGQALELRPEDPLVQYNAGTAALVAGAPMPDGTPAASLLESAAEAAPLDLGADAFYNLGTARLAEQDPAAAIDAFEQSLRLDPDRTDAKHNLELAQRMLDEQQEQQQQDRDEESPESDSQSPQQQDSGGEESDPSEQQEQQPAEGDASGDENRPDPDDASRQPLPDFEEQPEMTAEQAAAILEAVENLEREQRRRQALEQRKRAKGDRDW